MKNKMHGLALLLGLIFSFAVLPVAGKADEFEEGKVPGVAKAASYDDIMARGELVVALYTDYPPFSFKRDGEFVGIDAEIAKAVGKKMGLKVSFFEQKAGESVSDDLRNAIWRGRVVDHKVADLMLHIPVDKEFMLQNTEVAIFAPFFRDTIAVATDPAQINRYDGIDVFLKKKVGVEGVTLADQYLLTIHDGHLINNVVHFKSIEKAMAGMGKKEVSGVMGVRSEIEGAIATQGVKAKVYPIRLPGVFNGEWVVGMAVKNNNRQLANAVEDVVNDLIANGTIPGIFKASGVTYVPSYEKQ